MKRFNIRILGVICPKVICKIQCNLTILKFIIRIIIRIRKTKTILKIKNERFILMCNKTHSY